MKIAIRETLAATALFNGLEAEPLDRIAAIAVQRRTVRGQRIFAEGEEGSGLYIVAAGRVKIFKSGADGKEQILHIFGPGQPFGEVPVFAGQRFPASALALEPCRLIYLPRAAFVRLITDHPAVALNMLAVLSRRLREFTVQIENLALKEVPARLAAYLLALSAEQKTEDRVELHIPKAMLASILGTIPETLSRMLGKMSAQGLIRVDNRDIALRDRAGLKELAQRGRITAD
jgi:CRP/FNR family transcriptional regulator